MNFLGTLKRSPQSQRNPGSQPKWCQQVLLRPTLPHAPGVRMTNSLEQSISQMFALVVSPQKSICHYTNCHHKQYIQANDMFNYLFLFDSQEHVFITVCKVHLSGAGTADIRKGDFHNLYKDMRLEAQNGQYS